MAWRCRFLTARPSQDGRVKALRPTHWLISTQVCSTFIGLAVVAQELVEPSTALAQHLSYVATFFSYAEQVSATIHLAGFVVGVVLSAAVLRDLVERPRSILRGAARALLVVPPVLLVLGPAF